MNKSVPELMDLYDDARLSYMWRSCLLYRLYAFFSQSADSAQTSMNRMMLIEYVLNIKKR